MSGRDTSASLANGLPGHYADPNLVAANGRYLLYPTTDGSVNWSSRSFSAFSSRDLASWEDHGVILSLGKDVPWATERARAPTFASRSGRFYFYFTADDNIGVAVSDNPLGPFTDIGVPLVAAGEFDGRAIDPSVFVDADGSQYLLWGNGLAHIVRLADDMVSFDRSAVHTWVPTDFCEAIWLHRRGDRYYASWSVNDTRSENYHVRYATGVSPFGPWVNQGVLLEKEASRGILATGHHSILNVPGTDEWVIAYHRFGIPDGDGFHREIAFDRLIHRADGLIERVIPTIEPLQIPIN